MPDAPHHAAIAAAQRRTARAIADLRRGWPVVIGNGAGTGPGLLLLTVETAAPAELALMRESCAPLALLLTARRGAALHLPPYHDDAAAIAVGEDDQPADLAAIADATQDLERPLRGPFHSVPVPEDAAAALQLAKHARLLPSVVAGPLAPQTGQTLFEAASQGDFLLLSAADIDAYESRQADDLTLVAEARLPIAQAEDARLFAFRPADGGMEHLALVIGDPKPHDPVLLRLHSECFTGDILGSLRCDCGEQLKGAIDRLSAEGGILLYLRQEGRGIGLLNKLRAYSVQDDGFDTLDANLRLGFEADERVFRPAAKMLQLLGFNSVRLLTNNPDKVAGLEALGITVAERVPHAFPAHSHNEEYLAAKAKRSGHYLDVSPKSKGKKA